MIVCLLFNVKWAGFILFIYIHDEYKLTDNNKNISKKNNKLKKNK
jgi:hypothetical protein